MIRLDCQSIELQAAAAQDDPKGIRCSIAAYNGGEMQIANYGPTVVDTEGVSAAPQTPLLADHNSQLGGVVGWTQVNASGGKLTATGYVVPSTEAAKQIVALAKSGFAFQASIGLEPTEKEAVKPDTVVTVNGRQIKAGARGLTLVRAGVLKEISILPLGADSSTSVSIAATQKGQSMTTTTTVDPQEIIRAERERVSQIEAACAGFDGDTHASQVADLKKKAMVGEIDLPTLTAGLLGILRASRAMQTPSGATLHARPAESRDILSAALCICAGQEQAGERGFGAAIMQRARDMRFTNLTDIMKAAFSLDGRPVPHDADEMLRASGGAATPISLPGILSNTMHKVLLNAYQMFPSAARLIAKKLVAKDFKQHTEHRLTGDIALKPLPTSGEIQHAQLGEQKYPWQVDTYARLIKIDRKLIVNDDLSAFGTIPQMFGRGAALAQEDLFWSLVLGNAGDFFGAGNGNYLSGVTVGTNDSRLNMEGLTRATAAMMKLVDDAGYPINVVPRYLVVPPELKAAADALYRSTTVVASPTAAAGTPTIPSDNSFFGLCQPLTSPYLSNTSYSGYSASAWYIFGEPSDVAAFGIGYLNSMEAPVVEQVPNAPEQLGWCFRAFSDFGVTQLDPRGAVMSKGST